MLRFNLNLRIIVSAVSLSVATLLGCTAQKNSPQGIGNASFLDGLYSTRPEIEAPLLAIIKLQNPALLETATRQQGRLVIDKRLLKAIEAEQAQTIEELQKISPKIRVLIRYRLVLNGLAVWAPADVFEKIKDLPNVILGEKSGTFARPQLDEELSTAQVGTRTSVKFIGSEAAYAQGLHGEGMRIGIIDTGVDYTHKMFFGEGTAGAYQSVDPSLPHRAFPNKKVVGGIDIVGSKFNSSSDNWENRIPVPDANPLDEAGHGTHVAGTVAGIGDNVNTYSGVAPAADLYAIKVFGAKGSTSDEAVIAALEYAIDPTGDLSFKEQLDVVNLSLGSGHGNPHIMYNHAIRNAVRAGTVVVCAAGNNGDKPSIVGAPGVSDDAISVASTIDDMTQNIQFPAIEVQINGEKNLHEFIEGAVTKPLSEISQLSGDFIYLGFADTDFDATLKEKIKGKVALIDRGRVAFTDKIRRAQEAGAIAVVVANNVDGEAFVMGGEGTFEIPGVMITKTSGDLLKQNLKSEVLSVNFKPEGKVEKPWLADTVSPFSSRGPRSEDGLIKPEIAAPGSNIISALIGKGDQGQPSSGTSMASPHIAGVIALLKQKFPQLSAPELKSVLLGHGKVIADTHKNIYSVSRQGAGRTQVAASLAAKVVTSPASLSWGITDLETQKTMRQKIVVKNISDVTLTLASNWRGSQALQVSAPAVTLQPGESKTLTVSAKISAAAMTQSTEELDGFFTLNDGQTPLVQLPSLVVARKISQVQATSLTVQATSLADSAGSAADVVLHNSGVNTGTAYLFNLLGKDSRKKDPKPDLAHNRNCDLQSAGYRLLEKDGVRVLQIAVKLYEGQTTWHTCEVNMQIDADGDNKADQELAGLTQDSLPGLTGTDFISLLLDGHAARDIRKQFEKDSVTNPEKAKEDYTAAVIDQRPMTLFDNATLAIIEADVSALSLSDTGALNIKISTTHQDNGAIEYDDYLTNQDSRWVPISTQNSALSYSGMPEAIELAPKDTVTVPLTKGYGTEELILYIPQNRSVRDTVLEDTQSQIIPATYHTEE